MTHPHAHILQAIIDGREIQFSANGQYWDKITHNPDAEHDLILWSTDSFEFRIKAHHSHNQRRRAGG